jgi:hypothetical protein
MWSKIVIQALRWRRRNVQSAVWFRSAIMRFVKAQRQFLNARSLRAAWMPGRSGPDIQ